MIDLTEQSASACRHADASVRVQILRGLGEICAVSLADCSYSRGVVSDRNFPPQFDRKGSDIIVTQTCEKDVDPSRRPIGFAWR